MKVDTKDYEYAEGELNLLRMYKDTLVVAFKKYKGQRRVERIGVAMGISSKSVYRLLDEFKMRHLLKSK